MTVDMLAATFFWPEAMVLGAEPTPPDLSDGDPENESLSDRRNDDLGLWAAVRRLFGRDARAPDSAVPV